MKKGTKVYIQHIDARGTIVKAFRKSGLENQVSIKITKIPSGYGYRCGDIVGFSKDELIEEKYFK